MSGAQTYAGPNVLFDPLMASRQSFAENQLLTQQQDISGHEIEMGARLAGTLLSAYDTPEARAVAYPTLLAQARSVAPGYFKNAPAAYPGDEPTRALARLGTPSADLIKLQGTAGAVDAYGNSIGVSGGGGGGGAPGSRTATTGGTDTAPINAAGDSRTRKAGEGGPPAAGTPGAAVAQQVHDFWISKGFSEPVVAGIMAGGPGSESDFTPTVGGDKVNGVATSYGLYQHHGPRLAAMQQFFGLPAGQMPSADQQNQYAHWEITQGPLRNVGEMLKNAKTPAEAAAIWTQYFGVPADKSEIGRRAAGAQRFVGLYGQPQQGGPGGATAPVAPPGVQMGGAAPPPPGGAPGAYPGSGGGMGAVIGQGVRPNIGGPQLTVTSPPVIRAQPIPGTASNADIIMGGVQQAQATPLPGTQVAGPPMVASTNPTAAVPAPPVETPTPARYAGTAPAPSVEAPPETGWGSQVGSGYGPQNTLAPPPPPAQPAAPAAQQPPASTAQPAAQAMPPELQTDNNYLTPKDKQQLAPLFDQARRGLIPLTTLQNEVQQRQTFNVQRQKDFLAAQQQQMENARQVEADRRAAETQRLAQITSQREQDAAAALAEQRRIENERAAAKAKQEAEQLAKPQQSKSDEADAERVLFTIGPKVRAAIDGKGPPLTEAEADQYDVARRRYARGPLQQVPDGKGGMITAFVGQDVPDRFPPLPGQKEYAGLKPIPGTEKQPDFAPANAMTAMLDIGEGNRKIVRALDSLNAYPGGVGAIKGSLPNIMQNWTDPEGVKLRSDIGDVQSHVFHTLSGAAVTASEAPRLKSFSPNATDTADALKIKLQRMLDVNRETLLDHYRAFGPDAGGRKMPGVEEEILSTIPQTALDHLKENPTLAKDFDKQFGRGSSKLVLQNG